MQHWHYLVDHWADVSGYVLATARGGIPVSWLKLLAPLVAAALASGVVSMIVTQVQVNQLQRNDAKQEEILSKGILPLADERMRSMQLQMLQFQHQHEAMREDLAALRQDSPIRCLDCHMTKRRDHPTKKGAGP